MRTFHKTSLLHCCMFMAIILGLFSVAEAAEKSGYTGWEEDSPYNAFYNYKDKDSLKGTILQFKEVNPLPGMDPGTAFIFEEGGEKILVHLCPVAFSGAKETGIRTGIKTKVNGCWAVIDGEDVFMAAKVKQGDSFEFKVRLTKDGKPFWSMSPEELAKERAAN
jgi:hypothetical protein